MSERSKYCCPACGHPILPTDPLAILSPTERAIFEVIHAAGQAGISREAIMDRVYGTRLNGGPSSWRSIVSVHLGNMNKRLRWLNLRVVSDRSRPASYTVVPFQDKQNTRSGRGRTRTMVRAAVNGVLR